MYAFCCFQVKSISSQALSSAVSDIGSVVRMVDRIARSAPGNGSRASVGEDLVAMTKCRLQARNFMTQEGMMATKKMKRHTTAMPLSVSSLEGSVGDNYKQFACSGTSDLESTATSDGKKARTEVWVLVRLPLVSEAQCFNFKHIEDTILDCRPIMPFWRKSRK